MTVPEQVAVSQVARAIVERAYPKAHGYTFIDQWKEGSYGFGWSNGSAVVLNGLAQVSVEAAAHFLQDHREEILRGLSQPLKQRLSRIDHEL